MKKVVFIVIFITLVFTNFNVFAKDTVYSLNKYEEEKYSFILDSYNEEGKKDGLLAAGEVSLGSVDSENSEYDVSHVILVKYNYNGDVIWELSQGKPCLNTLDYLEYTYDEAGKVDGYLIVMPKTYKASETDENTNRQETFIKVDLNGKVVWEKDSSTEEIISITKIISTHNNENKADGYIAIAKTLDGQSQLLIKYDLELNIVWLKKQDKVTEKQLEYQDLETIYEEKEIIGYALIRKVVQSDNTETVELIKFNSNGEEENVINQELNKYLSVKLANTPNGIIVYGLTDEVKLKEDDISYYIIKYNNSLEEEWETIGEEPLLKDKALKLKAVEKDNEIEKYIIMYNTKSADEINTVVAEIDLDGLFVKKIKKITSSYYTIEGFNINGKTLYFIGQINCPADDDCEYNMSSLFLISDEDKVVEVKDNTSRNILLIMAALVTVIVIAILIKKRNTTKA